jgi:REP element-mobilizing transposase RayT
MTLPNPVHRHGLYLLTRRVIWQLFLLLPDRFAVQIFQYALGAALLSFKDPERRLQIHAGVLMSNHLHLVAYDPQAERTNFLNRFYSPLARAINKLRARTGRLFDLSSYKDKAPIMDRDSALHTIVYTICNPVKAGLVMWPHEWPGSLGDWRQILTVPISVTKPLQFFDQRGPGQGGKPQEVLYYLTMPTCFREDLTDAQYERLIRDAVRAECERIHAERNAPVLGVEAALALPTDTRSATPDTEFDRASNRFRCDPARVKEFLDLWVEWVACYMRIRDRWTSGQREGVEFPPGTDEYHRLEDAPIAELEPDSPFAWLYP